MSEATVRFDGDGLQQRILVLRDERVMIDSDLAELYGVEARVLNQGVKRNLERFPVDFSFVLTKEEKGAVITNCDHRQKLKFSPHLPRCGNTLATLVATIRQMATPPASPSRQIGFVVDPQEKK